MYHFPCIDAACRSDGTSVNGQEYVLGAEEGKRPQMMPERMRTRLVAHRYSVLPYTYSEEHPESGCMAEKTVNPLERWIEPPYEVISFSKERSSCNSLAHKENFAAILITGSEKKDYSFCASIVDALHDPLLYRESCAFSVHADEILYFLSSH